MSEATSWEPLRDVAPERRVVVLEADTMQRAATERLLRREDFWVVASSDPAAVVRMAAVSATDVILVELSLGLLEAVPRWQRRRGDVVFRGVPTGLTEGYAVLRPLAMDPTCARFPIVTLRHDPAANERGGSGRFAVVDYVPSPQRSNAMVDGLATVFKDVVLPAMLRESESAPASAEPRPFSTTPPALRTALVVDPDPTERRLVADCLLRHGFSVHQAGTSAEALRLAVARRPWLVITETALPDEPGVRLCRRMRAHSLLRRTPVVFLSNRDDCDTRHEAIKAGADEFLPKPAPSREMLIRLELLLKRFGEIESAAEQGAGLRGAIELVGAPAVLQICHLNGLSGVLVARRGSMSVRIGFRQGQIVSAMGPDHQGEPVIYDFVGWPQGQYEFDRGAVIDGPEINAEFNSLLLEGCRLLDERRRGRAPEAQA
ncbi:MAG: response regulator [Vicinamibacteria bacterium]